MRKKSDPIADLYRQVLTELGATNEPAFLDVGNTPSRVAKMLRDELLKGYKESESALRSKLRLFPATDMHEMVVQTGIQFTSLCAHHMLPFIGTAAIGYLPGKYLVGLSKLSRILEHFAARLQIQERLGAQVAEYLIEEVKADAAFVLLNAEHQCMSCRGVKKAGVATVTASVRPQPPDGQLLAEFYRMVAHGGRA